MEGKLAMLSGSAAAAASGSSPRPSFRLRAAPGDEPMSFRVPSLRCSFPSLLHPEYEVVREQCEGWILDVAQPPSAAARQFLLDCLLPRLLCRNIPKGMLARLIHVTKIISWLIIADDDDDHPDALGSDYAASAQHADIVMAILRKLGDDVHQEDNHPRHQFHHSPSAAAASNTRRQSRAGVEALREVWEEAHKDMPAGLRTRFVDTMADYFDAIKAQAAFRGTSRLPDMEAYIEIRRMASFILPAFALVEYAVGIEVDRAIYDHPLITQFRNAAMDYICFSNDLLSCRVENAVGDYFNLPSIVYNNISASCATFQDAVDRVAQMTDDLDARCVDLITVIHNSPNPALHQPCIHTYLAALSSCMSGCLAWFLETARYRQYCTREGLVVDPAT